MINLLRTLIFHIKNVNESQLLTIEHLQKTEKRRTNVKTLYFNVKALIFLTNNLVKRVLYSYDKLLGRMIHGI